MEEKLLRIIGKYGINNQLRKFNEEAFELEEAIIRYEDDKYYMQEPEALYIAKEFIIEEIADVCVMLLQFKEYYHIDGNDILRIMNEKIDRQLNRIEKEVKDE